MEKLETEMEDLNLREDAPLWARAIWCLVRKAAGAAWLAARLYLAVWLARLLVPEFFYGRKTIELGQPEVFFIVAVLFGLVFIVRES